MITPKIAANQAFSHLKSIQRHDDQQKHQSAGEGTKKSSTGDAIDGVKAEISAFSTHPIQQFNAEFNAVVKSIRIADQAMDEIGANIEQMESEIQMFVKQYPPYPPGSEERSELLNQFAALRKEIDRLSFPPDPVAQGIIGNTGKGEKNLHQAIRRQPVHTGEQGLNLPELPPDASDKAIADMQVTLGNARKMVNDRRGQLADDIIKVIRQADKTE